MSEKLKGKALVKRLNEKVAVGTRIVHSPTNNDYIWLGASLHTETGEVMINYMNQAGEPFSRPFDSFYGKYFNADDDRIVNRFNVLNLKDVDFLLKCKRLFTKALTYI